MGYITKTGSGMCGASEWRVFRPTPCSQNMRQSPITGLPGAKHSEYLCLAAESARAHDRGRRTAGAGSRGGRGEEDPQAIHITEMRHAMEKHCITMESTFWRRTSPP